VSGRPAAPRRPGRGAPLSSSAAAWEAGAVVLASCGDPVELLDCTGPRPIALEEGDARERTHGSATACSGVREPVVLRPLKAGAAGAAVWGPASSECACGLGMRAWQEERTTDRGVERDGGTARYDAVNAARVPRRSARRGVGGSRLETVARSRRDAEATR
jgi:hypothetical protein